VVCAVLAQSIGQFLEFPVAELESGVYGYNGILYGLYVGSHFNSPELFVLAILAGSFLICLLTRGFNNSLGAFLKLPACSYPFVFATVIVSCFIHSQEVTWGIELGKPFSYQTGFLADYLAKPFHLTVFEKIVREVFWFVSSLGAIFFQKAWWSCLLVGLALFTSSRGFFALALAGFLALRGVCLILPVDFNGQEVSLGFNAVLIALGVGGFFFVPGRRTFFLMVLCQVVAIILGLSLDFLGHLTGAEFTALPFNLLVSGAVLMLQGRAFDAKPYQPVIGFSTPEEAFAYYRRFQERMFLRAVSLPVLGAWKIVQGFDGNETHKEQWQFGADLAAIDETGKRFRSTGLSLDDYFAFNALIRSPVDGTVSEVFDQAIDNPVGELNLTHPWGNYVIIYSAGIYVGLYHLKQGSKQVAVGQFITTGTPVGRGGNSGRSALPHLHFQIQLLAYAGAPNLPFLLRDTVVYTKAGEVFKPFSKPEDGIVLSEIEAGDELRPIFLPANGEIWRLKVNAGADVDAEVGPGAGRGGGQGESQGNSQDNGQGDSKSKVKSGRSHITTWTFHYTLQGSVVIADERKDEAEYRLNSRSVEILRFPVNLWSPLHLFSLMIADLPFHFRDGLRWFPTIYGRSATQLFSWRKRWLAAILGDIFSVDFQKSCLDSKSNPSIGESIYHVRATFPQSDSRRWLRESRIDLRFSLNGYLQFTFARAKEPEMVCEKIAQEKPAL